MKRRRAYASLFGAVAALACGSGGAMAANAAGELLSSGLGRTGREAPSTFSTSRGRCELFREYGLVCPVLPNCRALFGTRDPAPYNVCDDEGRLRALTVCKGWQGSEHWCGRAHFPSCPRYEGQACGEYETFVCEDEGGQHRVLRCSNDRYREPERRSVEASADAGAATAGECSDTLWTQLCQRVLDLEDLQPYLHPEVAGRVPLRLATGSPCDGRRLLKHGERVAFAERGEVEAEAIVVLERLECAPAGAEVDLDYAVEGVHATASFRWERDHWQVVARRVVER